jgi:23S rRNA (adenine2503-C2)-methyltransferase
VTNPAELPICIRAPKPPIHDFVAVEAFRKKYRIDPERVRRFRHLLYNQHRQLEGALPAFGEDRHQQIVASHFDMEVLKVLKRLDSAVDPSLKLLLETHDKYRLETVLIRSGPSRSAVCVSTQVGCQAGCPFCATARMGLHRNLTAAEIVQQVLYAAQITRLDERRLRNVVFMGMGEPLHNEEQLYEAIRFLNHHQTFNMPWRRISVSTVGVPDAMIRLIDTFPGIQMAFSLHSARPEMRARLVPWSRRYSWEETQEALRYVASRPKTHRHQGPVMIEHIMIQGVNDSDEDADALVEYLRGMYVMINLIPYNANEFIQSWQPTPRDRRSEFAHRLRQAGIYTTIRYSMGSDVQAACGQLVAQTDRTSVVTD